MKKTRTRVEDYITNPFAVDDILFAEHERDVNECTYPNCMLGHSWNGYCVRRCPFEMKKTRR
jgi:hypothetical protein